MEHVIVRRSDDGFWLDPRGYQAVLPRLASGLPSGASEFALDPQHYDFTSDRCVKDLWFRSLSLDEAGGSATLMFRPNGAKHETGLSLHYSGLVSASIERAQDPGVGWLGSLLLDELRPSPTGFIHEFAMTGGSIVIAAADVQAAWG